MRAEAGRSDWPVNTTASSSGSTASRTCPDTRYANHVARWHEACSPPCDSADEHYRVGCCAGRQGWHAVADAEGGGVRQRAVCVRRKRLQRTHGPRKLRGAGLCLLAAYWFRQDGPLRYSTSCCVQVNLGYVEAGVHKNALVKLRVCPEHALQLNYKKDAAVLKVCQQSRALACALCKWLQLHFVCHAGATGTGETQTTRTSAIQ